MVDPITDMFNRIRNAQMALKPTVLVVFSNFAFELARILAEKGFIEKVEKKGRRVKKLIEITLKYSDKTPAEGEARQGRPAEGEARQGRPAISGLKRISKPGQRIYVSARDIRPVKDGYGIAIISTPKGLMTDKEARKQRLGGEVICEIW